MAFRRYDHGSTGFDYSGVVSVFAELPSGSEVEVNDIYVVENSSGIPFINKKDAGLYIWNGLEWVYVGGVDDNIQENDPISLLNNDLGFITGNTFEYVSKNISSWSASISYRLNGDVDFITYTSNSLEVLKTFNYDGDDRLLSIVISGDIPSGTTTQKTFIYLGDILSGFDYS